MSGKCSVPFQKQILYRALLRRVAKDQDCSASYVVKDFTDCQRVIVAILKANTVKCPVETGRKIQYRAPTLRQVAKDQDCSAPYVGADFTEYQRSRVRLESSKTVC